MSEGKVKASKLKVHASPDAPVGAEAVYHVYVYDVFNKTFKPGRTFETIERAAQFKRHEQERIYLEQEADPELFDLPFVSTDAQLLDRIGQDAEYKSRLMRDLESEARARGRKR
jgi:hypothetical protein